MPLLSLLLKLFIWLIFVQYFQIWLYHYFFDFNPRFCSVLLTLSFHRPFRRIWRFAFDVEPGWFIGLVHLLFYVSYLVLTSRWVFRKDWLSKDVLGFEAIVLLDTSLCKNVWSLVHIWGLIAVFEILPDVQFVIPWLPLLEKVLLCYSWLILKRQDELFLLGKLRRWLHSWLLSYPIFDLKLLELLDKLLLNLRLNYFHRVIHVFCRASFLLFFQSENLRFFCQIIPFTFQLLNGLLTFEQRLG